MRIPAAFLPFVAAASLVSAQTSAPSAASTPAWGADLRLRDEYFDGVSALCQSDPLHENNLIRFRARTWGSVNVAEGLSLNARLTAEPRWWDRPSFAGAYKGRSGTEWRYALVDSCNVKWDKVGGQPLTITVGRQDIAPGEIGDGWLVGDGTPNDGSMTLFFDAVRAKYKAPGIKTEFNVVALYQTPRPDSWLPTVGSAESYPSVEQREQGLILQAANTSLPGTRLDGYFIYKHDDRETLRIAGVTKAPGDDADLYTVGGSISGTFTANLQYSLEGAYQCGWKQDKVLGVLAKRDVDAFGAKAKLTYAFKDARANTLSLLAEHLSGDKPGTTKRDEMFDVLWGRWPRWSDLNLYSASAEAGGRVGQNTNTTRTALNWAFNPSKSVTFSTTYAALFAPEAVPTRGPATLFSYAGHFRGHMLQAVMRFRLTAHLSGHLYADWMKEGNFYRQKDKMTFFRAETMYTF